MQTNGANLLIAAQQTGSAATAAPRPKPVQLTPVPELQTGEAPQAGGRIIGGKIDIRV